MTIKETIKKSGGKWLFIFKNNYNMIIDIDKKEWDSKEWYQAYGTLEQSFNDEMFDSLFKDIKKKKKIK